MILLDEQVNVISESCKMHRVLKDSHLEANARIRELEAIAEWHDILVNSDSYFRDRADRLAVIADALAEALKETEANTMRWLNTELKLGEIKAKLQELTKIVDAYSDSCLGPVDTMKQVIRTVDKEG